MKLDLVNIALEMRKNELTIKEIAQKVNRSTSTVKRWLAPYELRVSSKIKKENCLKGSLKMQENYAFKRKNAYEINKNNASEDLKNSLLRDFINIYIGEGTKKAKNTISIVNTDPKIILLSLFILKKYFLSEDKKIFLEIRHYVENNNEADLLKYWKNLINDDKINFSTYIQPTVKALGHNNSNQYGLITLKIHDAYAKQKLNAYMDFIKEEWTKEFELVFKTKFIEIL